MKRMAKYAGMKLASVVRDRFHEPVSQPDEICAGWLMLGRGVCCIWGGRGAEAICVCRGNCWTGFELLEVAGGGRVVLIRSAIWLPARLTGTPPGLDTPGPLPWPLALRLKSSAPELPPAATSLRIATRSSSSIICKRRHEHSVREENSLENSLRILHCALFFHEKEGEHIFTRGWLINPRCFFQVYLECFSSIAVFTDLI